MYICIYIHTYIITLIITYYKLQIIKCKNTILFTMNNIHNKYKYILLKLTLLGSSFYIPGIIIFYSSSCFLLHTSHGYIHTIT